MALIPKNAPMKIPVTSKLKLVEARIIAMTLKVNLHVQVLKEILGIVRVNGILKIVVNCKMQSTKIMVANM